MDRLVFLLVTSSIAWNTERFVVNAGCSGGICNICFCRQVTTRKMFKVDCSNKKLTEIPHFLPNSTIILLLNNNIIKRLSQKDLNGCVNLQELRIDNNVLSYIGNKTFIPTPNLRKLSLNGNNIVLSSLPTNAFTGLRNLKALFIKDNMWRKSTGYNGRLFTQMLNICTLKIDGLPGIDFPPEFKRLSRMTRLFIYGGMRYITNTTFEQLSNSSVEDLEIDSDLRSMEPYSFSHFTQLKNLSLNGNRHLGLGNASVAWYGLKHTKIQKLKLQSLSVEYGDSVEVGPEFSNFLDQLNITVLDLSRNDIYRFKVNLSTALPRVRNLYLAQNRLVYTQALVDNLAQLETLEILDISRQLWPVSDMESSRREKEKFEEFEALEIYDSNKLENIQNEPGSSFGHFGSCITRRLQECSNSSSVFHHPFRFETDRRKTADPVCFTIGPRLRAIFMTEAVRTASRSIEQVVISGGGNLRAVFMGSSGLTKILGPVIFEKPVKNLTVNLNDNQISCFATRVFCASAANGSNVAKLNLAGNRLAKQLEKDYLGETFQCLKSLKSLNLSRNGIKVLPREIFQHLKNIEQLDLSQNAIRIVEFEFIHMTNLELLDISYNLLTVLNDTLLSEYSEMFSTVSKKLRLDLSGNPFQCSCDTLRFLHWLQSYSEVRLKGFASYSCFYSNRLVRFANLTNYVMVELEFVCDKKIAVIVSGVLFGVALISVAMSAFCYRHRWEIRYSCLKLTQQGKRYQQLVSSDTQYEYDAFVVYDSEDRDWVNSELVPQLEQSNTSQTAYELSENESFCSLRLCIHERDFQPGEHIISNIWDKLERSRKVVLVVSNNFAKSKYCDYEMNLARVLSVEQSRDVMVPVLLDLPDVETVSSTLHRILRTVTYIEWPCCEGEEREHFWMKLRTAIGTNQQ